MDAGDARAFERRLAEDAILAAEVRRLRGGALGPMPLPPAAEPPPSLRARIVAASEGRARTAPPAPAPRTAPPRRAPRVVWSRFAAAAAAALALAFGLDATRTRRELAL